MQKELILILGLFALYWFFMRSEGFSVEKTSQAIPPSVIQTIIRKIVKDRPSLHPIETVFLDNYFDNASGSTLVMGRFMFLDTESYSGIQYDVEARLVSPSNVQITNISTTVSPELSGPFMPYGKAEYIKFKDVAAAIQPAAKPDWLINSNKI